MWFCCSNKLVMFSMLSRNAATILATPTRTGNEVDIEFDSLLMYVGRG